MNSRILLSIARLIVFSVLTLLHSNIIAQTASDQASNYGGTWNNSSNQGTGFGAWSLTSGTNSGFFIGNPANNLMSTTLTGTTAFGMFANGSAYANASRNISTPLAVGDALSFHWAINWDANTGSKGFDFKAAGTTVFNVNIGGSSTITAGGSSAQTAYGTNNMIVTMARISGTQYTFTLTARDGVSAIYSSTVNIGSAIDNINFYIGNQNDGNGNRNMYFNNLQINKIAHRSSVAAGNWATVGSWEQSHDNGVSWVAATVSPSSALGTVQIRNGHNITVAANVTGDQITVDQGGTLTVSGTSVLTIANGTEAIDCMVNGLLVNTSSGNPSVNTTAGNLTIGSTGEYQHNVTGTGGTIPLATWQSGSTCRITGMTSFTSIGNIGQTFHHLIWNCPNQTSTVNFVGALAFVNGDLTITDTGTGKIVLTAGTAANLVIGGSLTLNSTIAGHGAVLDMASGNSTSSIMTIKGGLSVNTGTITASNTTNLRDIYFAADNGSVQLVNQVSGTLSGSINWHVSTTNGSIVRLVNDLTFSSGGSFSVEAGGVMDFGIYALKGTVIATATFSAASGSHLISANTAALGCFQTGTIATTGSVQAAYGGGRTFTSPSYTFNGTNQQWTGNALTSNIVNLTINNTGTTSSLVNVTNAFNITGVLTLTSGILNLGNFSVNVTSPSATAIVGGSGSAYVRTGTAVTGSLGRFGRAIATTGLPITYLLPVGNSTSYMPATFTFSANSVTRNVTIFAMDGTHSSLSAATNYLANRHWITSLSVGTGTYSYTSSFGFLSTDVVGGFSTLKLYRATNLYTDAGSSATATSVTSGPLDQTTGALSSNVAWTALGSGAALTSQTITFNALAAITYGSTSTLSLTATASSGLPVSYTVVSGPATVSGSTLTITGAGSVVVQASQSGDATYNAAAPVSQTLVVNPKALTVSGAVAQNKVFDGTTTATISGATLVGIVGADVVTISGGGTFAQSNAANGIAVTAALTLGGAQSGNYTLTQPTGLTANITQASQTISFGALSSVPLGSANFNLTATASSGLTVAYSSSNTAVATVSGNVVTIVGIGTTTITASQSGNTNYAAAANVTQNLVVTAGSLVTWDMSTQTGGTNNFGPSPLNGVLSTNVASAQLLRGAGVSTAGTGAAGGWGGVNWSLSATAPTGSTSYIDATVRVSPGFAMSLSQINSFGYRRSGSGPVSAVLSYSIDGSTFSTVTTLSFPSSANAGATHAAIDLSAISALQSLNNCTTVTFRITPYGATGTGGTFYIYNVNASTAPDFSIAGSVSALALDPSVSVTSNDADNLFCSGTSVTFTASASASTPIAYQWKSNGVNILGATSSTYTSTSLSTSTITVTVDACGEFATSNGIANTVITSPTITLTSSSGANTCAGTTPTFTASGATSYDFFVNGTSQGTASATNTFTPSAALVAGDIICVRGYDPLPFTIDGNLNDAYWGTPLATSATGPTSSGFGANRIDALYLKNGFGYLFGGIAGSLADNSGNKVLMFIDSKSGGFNNLGSWVFRSNAPYESMRNLNGGIQFDAGFEPDLILGINIAGGTVYYDLYDMTTNTNLYLDDTNNALYAYISNTGTGDYSKGFEFSIPINYLGNYGTSIKAMAMVVNDPGFSAATFLSNQFLSAAGSSEGNYGNGAVNFGLATPNAVTYSVIQDCYSEQCITVASSVTPSVTITSSDADNSICSGTSVTFTATPTNGGTTPAYQWKLNGTNVGTDATTYTNASLSNNDVVTVVLTANNACQTSATANGNNITTAVINNVTPSVSITSSDADNSICQGTSVTFTATPTNGGTTQAYQWKLNGTNVGTDATTYTNAALANNDVVTVVLTANNACQTSATANGNNITILVGLGTTYYLDLDLDGYGANGTSVTDCVQPNGYVQLAGDCNPSNEMVYPGAVEFCNQTDDDCDGIVDEDLVFQDFYLDNDGDGYGANSSAFSACDLPAGYIVLGGDCNDANINVFPGGQELCSTNIDDDCDGLINEICAPGNDNSLFASNCPLSISTTLCNLVTGTLQGASPSGSFGSSTLSNNNDVWYYFTANGPGMTIRCTPTGNDVGLELRSSSGQLLKFVDATSNPTDEYMNYNNLTIGSQYYLRVMNMNSSQSGFGFTLCSRRIYPGSSAFNYTNVFVYNTGCTTVAPTNLSTLTSSTIILTPVNGSTEYLAPGPTALLGDFLSQDGFGVPYNNVYTGRVLKSYNFPSGDGSTEILTFDTPMSNTLNVLPCVDVDLGSNYVCPRLWTVGSMMRADRWICGAVKYQWRFEQYLNGQPYLVNGNPVIIEQYGPNNSRDFYTLPVYGFTAGTEWRVKIRPVFPNDVHGDYGTDEQCLRFKGTFAASPLIEDEEAQQWNTEGKYTIFPNPSIDGQLSIIGNDEDASLQHIVIRDAAGRLVKRWENNGEEQTMVSMNLSDLKSGLYWISISVNSSEHHQRWIKQ